MKTLRKLIFTFSFILILNSCCECLNGFLGNNNSDTNSIHHKNNYDFSNLMNLENIKYENISKLGEEGKKKFTILEKASSGEYKKITIKIKGADTTFIIFKNIKKNIEDLKKIAKNLENDEQLKNFLKIKNINNNPIEESIINFKNDPFLLFLTFKQVFTPYGTNRIVDDSSIIFEELKSFYEEKNNDIKYFCYIEDNNRFIPLGCIIYSITCSSGSQQNYYINNISFFSNPFRQGKGYMSAIILHTLEEIMSSFSANNKKLKKIYINFRDFNYPSSSITYKIFQFLKKQNLIYEDKNEGEDKNKEKLKTFLSFRKKERLFINKDEGKEEDDDDEDDDDEDEEEEPVVKDYCEVLYFFKEKVYTEDSLENEYCNFIKIKNIKDLKKKHEIKLKSDKNVDYYYKYYYDDGTILKEIKEYCKELFKEKEKYYENKKCFYVEFKTL